MIICGILAILFAILTLNILIGWFFIFSDTQFFQGFLPIFFQIIGWLTILVLFILTIRLILNKKSIIKIFILIIILIAILFFLIKQIQIHQFVN